MSRCVKRPKVAHVTSTTETLAPTSCDTGRSRDRAVDAATASRVAFPEKVDSTNGLPGSAAPMEVPGSVAFHGLPGEAERPNDLLGASAAGCDCIEEECTCVPLPTRTRYTTQLKLLASLDQAHALPSSTNALFEVGAVTRVAAHLLRTAQLTSGLYKDLRGLALTAAAAAAAVASPNGSAVRCGARVEGKRGHVGEPNDLLGCGTAPVAARSAGLELLAVVLFNEVADYLTQVETLDTLFHTSRRLRAQVLAPGGAPRLRINAPTQIEGALRVLAPAALHALRAFRFWDPHSVLWPHTLARLLGALGPHLRTLDLQEHHWLTQKAIVSVAVWPALEELSLVLAAAPVFVDKAPVALPALRRLSLRSEPLGQGIDSLSESKMDSASHRALGFLSAAPAVRLKTLHLDLVGWNADFGRELARLAPGLEALQINLRMGGGIVQLPPLPRIQILSLVCGRFEMAAAPHPELHTLLLGRRAVARVAAASADEEKASAASDSCYVDEERWRVDTCMRLNAPKLHTLELPPSRRCAAETRRFASAGALERLKFECARTFGAHTDPTCDCPDFGGGAAAGAPAGAAAAIGGAATGDAADAVTFGKLRDVRADMYYCTQLQGALALFALPQLAALHFEYLQFEYVGTPPPHEWFAPQHIGACLREVTFACGSLTWPPWLPAHIAWKATTLPPFTRPWQ